MKTLKLLLGLALCSALLPAARVQKAQVWVWIAAVQFIVLTGLCHAFQQVDIGGRSVSKLKADPYESRMYGLVPLEKGTNTGSLLVIDTTTRTVSQTVPLGHMPTDIALSPGGSGLFIINYLDCTIQQYDRHTLQPVRMFHLPYTNNTTDIRHFDLAIGISNRIFCTDDAWEPLIHILDPATGSELGNFTYGGAGDIAFDSTGGILYLAAQYGWNPGQDAVWLRRLDCTAGIIPTVVESSPFAMERSTMPTPVLPSADGLWVVVHNYRFSATNFSSGYVTYPENIYEASTDDQHVIGYANIRDSLTGSNAVALPFPTSVMAMNPASQDLYLFNPNSNNITLVNFVTPPMFVRPNVANISFSLGCPVGPSASFQVDMVSPYPWNCSTTDAWMSVMSSGGTSSGIVTVRVDALALSVGSYTGFVSFTSGVQTSIVAVAVKAQPNPLSVLVPSGLIHPGWVTNYDLSGGWNDHARFIRTYSNDCIVVGGEIVSGVSTQSFLLSCTPTGQQKWFYLYDGPSPQTARMADLIVSSNGTAYALHNAMMANSNLGVVVSGFDATGQKISEWTYGNVDTVIGSKLGRDTSGGLLVACAQSNFTGGSALEVVRVVGTGSVDKVWSIQGGSGFYGHICNGFAIRTDDVAFISGVAYYPNAPQIGINTRCNPDGGTGWVTVTYGYGAGALVLNKAGDLIEPAGVNIQRISGDSGAISWTQTTSYAWAQCAIVLDNDDNVYLPATYVTSKNRPILVKYSSSGSLLWVATHDQYNYSGGHEYMYGAACDSQGAVVCMSSVGILKFNPLGAECGQIANGLQHWGDAVSVGNGKTLFTGWSGTGCYGDNIWILSITGNNANDYDEDGLPNDWETQNYGNSWGSFGTLDSDGDGWSNWQEFIIDSQPTNALSSFPKFDLHNDAGMVHCDITNASTNRLYEYEWKSDLMATGILWQCIATQSASPYGIVTIPLTNLPPSGFIRTRVVKP